MNVRTTIGLGVVAVATLGAVGYGAWTAGMRSGMEMGSSQPAPRAASAPQDPDAWSVVQGGEATARHLRDGLKAGDAVIHTGRRSVVMLAEDGGHFRPVEVRAGREAGGQTEIVQGLQAGQRVVLSGQFLIDSEASLRGLETRLNQAPAAAAAPAAAVDLHRTDAVIDAVDGDSVTLTHPAIPALKWPGMTMAFRLPPPEQRPSGLSRGDPVRIEFHTQDGAEPQITRIERVAPPAQGAKP